MKQRSVLVRGMVFVVAALMLGGCASHRSGSTYSRDQARQVMSVRFGVVESVREVTLEGSQSGTGTLAGAVVGGIAGSHVGGGKGQVVGAILGAVAGGVAGTAIEEELTHTNALEITVKLDDGQYTAIVQEGSEFFHVGERVRVLYGRGTTRVTH